MNGWADEVAKIDSLGIRNADKPKIMAITIDNLSQLVFPKNKPAVRIDKMNKIIRIPPGPIRGRIGISIMLPSAAPLRSQRYPVARSSEPPCSMRRGSRTE